jgi:hypothetical protein
MKKVLAIALLSLAAVSSWAQGTVQFQNGQISFATVADRFVYLGAVGGAKLDGTNYAAGLFYMNGADQAIMSPTAGTLAGGLAFFRQPTTTQHGIWANPGTAGNTRILDGVPILATATLQVRVWDTTKYASFAQAFAANDYGWSQPFNQRMPDFAHGDPAALAYMEGFRAFAVGVPEPSTIALGVLGVAGLLALRRRKQA